MWEWCYSDKKEHYDEIMMGDQLNGHPDVEKLYKFGLFSYLYFKITKKISKLFS